ncbi:flagellar basal body rod protein FlgB [Kordiimonas aquimaris]|uniref:flagellar basal body rod protein FlgB n=1 Tax=Kordiimonas aquimaris TaxID=707591 RepID=UPI0021D35318|nr:flagellar basal body rod protein FlgB [Kordiimonas aquimaris]
MDLTSIPLMAAMKKRMQWLHSNQSVLSQNVANADTPGYKGQKLERQDFSGLVDDLSGSSKSVKPSMNMRASQAGHMTAGGGMADKADIVEDKDAEESPTGNTVVLEEEMIRVADNQMEYGMMVNLYKKNMGLLKIALGRGGGR